MTRHSETEPEPCLLLIAYKEFNNPIRVQAGT